MESIVLNANHIMSTIGETKAEPADMYARIAVPISMTFQVQSSIKARYLSMWCCIYCLIWIIKQLLNCLKSWITAGNAFQEYPNCSGKSYWTIRNILTLKNDFYFFISCFNISLICLFLIWHFFSNVSLSVHIFSFL